MELTEKQFFAGDARRAPSPVRDYGYNWHWIGRDYRVTYFDDTEELVAVCRAEGIYEILGHVPSSKIGDYLMGWAEEHNKHDRDSLSWVRRLVSSD